MRHLGFWLATLFLMGVFQVASVQAKLRDLQDRAPAGAETTGETAPQESGDPTKADDQPEAGERPNTSDQPAKGDLKEKDQTKAGLGRLPWAEGREEIRPAPLRLPTPRAALEQMDIGESQIKKFSDGEAFESDDEETLFRILYEIRRFRPHDIAYWRREPPKPWSKFVDDPDSFRTEFFEIAGRVKRVERREMLPEVARLYDFKHYYLVSVAVDGGDTLVQLCCLQIPESWNDVETLDEAIVAAGMFLKVGEPIEEQNVLVFATPRIEWRPDKNSAVASVTPSEVSLASLGVDIGWFDVARKRNGRRMGDDDREPFYQILAAVPHAQPAQVQTLARPFDLTDAIKTPQKLQAGWFKTRGVARRITRVLISSRESDIRERYDIDHYYMIDFFIPLGDLSLQLSGKDGQASSPVYQNGFPAVVCVRSLPPELERINKRLTEGQSGEELLNEEIEFTGVFFRLWSFRSEFVTSFDSEQRQVSPMFLASSPRLVQREGLSNPYLGVGVACVFLVALAVVWVAVWRAGKKDERFERETLRKRRETPEGKSLNDLDLEASDGPDFSGLD